MILIGIVHSFCSGEDTIIEFFKKKEFIYKDEDENENTPDKILQLVKSNWKSKNYMTKVNTIKALDTYRQYPLFMLIAVDDEVKKRFERSKKEFSEFLKDNDRLWNETREILSMADLTIIPSKNDIHNRLNQIIPGTNPIKIPEIFRPSKDAYFMRLAEVVGLRTNCLKRKVGCVLVKDECKVIATGYNGTPKDINNCNEGNCDYCNEGKDLGIDFCSCMHAERNALLIAGINAKDCILYCNTFPCLGCAVMLIQAKVKKVFYHKPFRNEEYMKMVIAKLKEAKVDYGECSPGKSQIGLCYDPVNSRNNICYYILCFVFFVILIIVITMCSDKIPFYLQ